MSEKNKQLKEIIRKLPEKKHLNDTEKEFLKEQVQGQVCVFNHEKTIPFLN